MFLARNFPKSNINIFFSIANHCATLLNVFPRFEPYPGKLVFFKKIRLGFGHQPQNLEWDSYRVEENVMNTLFLLQKVLQRNRFHSNYI